MNDRIKRQKVVITGMGVTSPVGSTLESFGENLANGKTGAKWLDHIDLSRCRTKIGAPVTDLILEDHFSSKELKRLSRASQLGIIAAEQAVTNSGIDFNNVDPFRFGVILGSSIGGYTAAEPFFEEYFDGWQGSPVVIPKVMNNAPASNISIRYSLQGPLLTTDAACASAPHAIGYAYRQIQSGIIDLAITGGADSALSPAIMQAWSVLRVLSRRNDTPKEACRPFSKDRDGILLGEGAGILILESEDSALARGAHIYAELTGYGASSDGHHITQPTEAGPTAAMQAALKDAHLSPEQIDYINAHATATPWNDGNETNAIKKVFGKRAYDIPIVGIKPAVGHSIAATGALELISSVLSIQDGILPPTLNVLEPDPECDLDYVTEGARTHKVSNAMSNSFAFGGSNAVLILSRYS